MSKKPRDPDKGDQETNDQWEKHPNESFDAYCPRCQVSYPASSSAHSGH